MRVGLRLLFGTAVINYFNTKAIIPANVLLMDPLSTYPCSLLLNEVTHVLALALGCKCLCMYGHK